MLSKTSNKFSLKEKFRIFEEETKYWIAKLGLVSWRIIYEFSNDFSEDWDVDAKAMFRWDLQSKAATIWLNKDWAENAVMEDICQTAYHEVYEISLVPLRCLAQNAYVVNGQVEREVHTIIRTMENTQFTDDYSKRQVLKKNKRK